MAQFKTKIGNTLDSERDCANRKRYYGKRKQQSEKGNKETQEGKTQSVGNTKD